VAGRQWAEPGAELITRVVPPPRPQDQKVQLTVLTDRAQGGSSIFDGSLELMVRGRGVGGPQGGGCAGT